MRVSLRTLMIVVTVAGVIAGLVGNKYHSRRRAYAVIANHNVVIDFSDSDAWLDTPIGASLPKEFTANVARINVRGEPLRGELLWAVSQLREAMEVIITNTEVGTVECDVLARLPRVQTVSLHGSTIELGCLAALCRSKSLQKLGLSFTNTTDSDCEYIAQCNSVTKLDLSGTLVTDVGLQSIAALPSLSYLAISPDDVTPAGIEAVVARHPRLVIQCYGPKKFEDDWATKIEQRYPQCKIHQ